MKPDTFAVKLHDLIDDYVDELDARAPEDDKGLPKHKGQPFVDWFDQFTEYVDDVRGRL